MKYLEPKRYNKTIGILIIVNPAIVIGISVLYLDLNDIKPPIKVLDSFVCKNTIAIKSSFQVNNALTTVTVITAGKDNGIRILVRTWNTLHPSRSAASIVSFWIVEKNWISCKCQKAAPGQHMQLSHLHNYL